MTISQEFHRQAQAVQPDGIGLATMPIGINHIESVNVYLVEDGDSVALWTAVSGTLLSPTTA